MEIKTLEELQAPDERTLVFSPLGLGGKMRPQDAADFQQRVVARAQLADDVAETTRAKFEQLRAAYVRGVLCYELFTLVEDQAQLALEQALRDRFAARYLGQDVEVRDRRGRVHRIAMASYPAFFERFRELKGVEIRTGAPADWVRFNGMLGGLLSWARHEGLLRGQRNRTLEPVLQDMRNHVAHGSYGLSTPVDAARTLSDLAEIINHLWGHPTPGGRLYPAPVERGVVALGWSKSGDRICAARAEDLTAEGEDDELTWLVIRAVYDDPGLMEYDARHATTRFPAQYLWGPGPRAEAAAWLALDRPEPDQRDHLDQVVLVRSVDGEVGLPMYPAIAAGLPAGEQAGTWYAVRVDRPLDALGHVRALAAGGPGHRADGECRGCPAETLAVGDITAVLQAAGRAGAAVAAVEVPDVRTPFAERYTRR
ncbi:hypothetical protein [Streptacidiphilus jiangxiensis]|uniref:Uncharacterized protein n=1 Tax=Streptacidiphilus jiangxiensis TaxID=235985 RepID=A0A1H8ACU0_STRJI|nr:hypothetical protein [Streptacidiphilus jiangxiensis]SEM68373.1 hypothetical protein SAMN05414137_14331 [Streptacidiphilus jiangxiensis]